MSFLRRKAIKVIKEINEISNFIHLFNRTHGGVQLHGNESELRPSVGAVPIDP
tara:strand:- start:512 stop:670 length:159 start_codon:yes stop_codon:yes gene_type:complete